MKDIINEEINGFIEVLNQHGFDLIQALLILIVGLVTLHWLMRKLKPFLYRVLSDRNRATTILGTVYILTIAGIISAILVVMDFESATILRLLIIVSLAAIAALILLKPYIPALPFIVGNTVKIGSHLGKIEAISLIHTQLRTFDGKTVFIPNSKPIADSVINYQFTPTRRIKINIPIRNISEILKTKQLMEKIMIEDPRVLLNPARPVVYVLNLVDGCVELGARCWVNNEKFWVAQCELLEKFLSAIDREKIALAFRSQVVSLTHKTPLQVENTGVAHLLSQNLNTEPPVSVEKSFSAIDPKDIEI